MDKGQGVLVGPSDHQALVEITEHLMGQGLGDAEPASESLAAQTAVNARAPRSADPRRASTATGQEARWPAG